jgi:hypothetical protein
MDGWGAFVLAAAAGLNPWLTLLITAGLAAYTPYVPLTPGFAPVVGTALVVVLAVLLGLDVAASKVPRLMRVTERLSGPAAAVAGAALCLAVPNALLAHYGAFALVAGAAFAFATRLGRRWAALALREPLGGYRFGYALASLATNTLAGVVTAATFLIGP